MSIEEDTALDLLRIIVANAVLSSDPEMGHTTDIYAVPMDDIEKARDFILNRSRFRTPK